MKVLVVSHFHELEYGAWFHTPMRRLMNGLIRNGHAVYGFSDRDEARRSNIFKTRTLGVKPTNKRVLQAADNFRPDLILFGHADIITDATLDEFRQLLPQVRLAYVNVDPIFDSGNASHIHRFARFVDSIFITTADPKIERFCTKSCRVSFIPNPVDSSMDTGRSFELDDPQYSVFFGFSPIHKDATQDRRVLFVNELKAKMPDLRMKTPGFQGEPKVFDWRFFDMLSNSAMGLSLSKADDVYLYSSDRLAQYMGNGLLTVISDATGYQDIFSADEACFYKDLDDCVEKIRYFDSHTEERQAIARNGWEKSRKELNTEKICRYIEEVIFERALSSDYVWPLRSYRAEA